MTPDRRISWVLNGKLTHVLPESAILPVSEIEYLSRKGAVKITETPGSMEVKWVLFAANWASLYYLVETIHLYSGPFTFRYFLSGWFTENIKTAAEAKLRLEQLIAKSDVHLGQHTFVQEGNTRDNSRIPHILRDALSDMTAIPELSVDCVLDDESGKFLVQRVGSQSTIAKVYGMSPVSIPCLTGNTYDEVVSAAYPGVLENDEPHYDHVLAAMNFPNQTVEWVPYQRVILPHRFPNGQKGISVTTEMTTVDIKVV